jgi:hypothetical protein
MEFGLRSISFVDECNDEGRTERREAMEGPEFADVAK